MCEFTLHVSRPAGACVASVAHESVGRSFRPFLAATLSGILAGGVQARILLDVIEVLLIIINIRRLRQNRGELLPTSPPLNITVEDHLR